MEDETPNSTLKRWYDCAGFAYFIAVSLLTTFWTSFGSSRIHYPIFEQATRNIFQSKMAYGFPYEAGTGYATLWLYSPSCALFFFSLFAFLPTILGKIFYLLLSTGVFISGVLAAARAVGFENTLRRSHFFWILVSFEMVGALSAYKIEVITTGILLWAFWALQTQRAVLGCLLLAIVTNWKFQGLPVAGLLLLTDARLNRSWRNIILFVVALSLYSAAPFLFLSQQYLLESQRVWIASLTESLQVTWSTYQHIYAVALNIWPQSFSLKWAQAISALAGLGFALDLFIRSGAPKTSRINLRLLAVGLGSAWIILFSPMSQSLAYILWTPLVLCAWILFKTYRQDQRLWIPVLWISAFLASMSYSDLTPQPIRGWFRQFGFKPVGILLLVVVLLWQTRRKKEAWSEAR